MANYLYKILIHANRKVMTGLRLRSHKLVIERGKYCLKIDYASYVTNLKMSFMLFVNAHVMIHVENYISSHIMLENQAWLS